MTHCMEAACAMCTVQLVNRYCRMVLGRAVDAEPATLSGYKRYRSKKWPYPGLAPAAADDRCEGMVGFLSSCARVNAECDASAQSTALLGSTNPP
jgi:hypothetical protein